MWQIFSFALIGVIVGLFVRDSKRNAKVDEALEQIAKDESEQAAALRAVENTLLEIEGHFSG